VTEELDKILISYKQPNFDKKLERLRGVAVEASTLSTKQQEQVRRIISDVFEYGDKAVSEFTEKFDNVKLTCEQFKISEAELAKAHKEIDKSLLASIRQAIKNVRDYQQDIFIGDKKYPGLKYTPIKNVGICIPGASAPLPSTVIMTAVPAQVAGVKKIVVVSPPRYQGSIDPTILALCHELKITEVYRVGGAQAVAALASEKGTIPKVDKIVGPGNQWVQSAKKMVLGCVGIDSVAGPSEVLIIANDDAKPAWVAADMLSQAEHAPGSAIVCTDSQQLAEKVLTELKKQVTGLDRAEQTVQCLEEFSGIVVFSDMAGAIEAANDFASEHLEIQCGDKSREVADEIENAGAIFIGDYSPVALGDYWAGPSHTLPTGAGAKFFSALSSNDFIKSTSIIEYDKEKLAQSAEDIIRLAKTEGLDAHARSIQIRCE